MADRSAPKTPGKPGASRDDRLKAALKANMARRKALLGQDRHGGQRRRFCRVRFERFGLELETDPGCQQALSQIKQSTFWIHELFRQNMDESRKLS